MSNCVLPIETIRSEEIGGVLYELIKMPNGQIAIVATAGEVILAHYEYQRRQDAGSAYNTLTAANKLHLKARQRILDRT